MTRCEYESSDDSGSGDGDKSGDSSSAEAALPDTGAESNLQLIGGTGIASLILGLFMVVATPRRRDAAHRA